MLTRPAGLTDAHLVTVLRAGWDLGPASAEYRPLGFGSHHWQVIADDGTPWFVTADDLVTRLRTATDTCDAGYHRLQAGLRTARALADTGASFVVAPVRTGTGDVLIRVGPTTLRRGWPAGTGWPTRRGPGPGAWS
jgi:hypothetical protein